MFKKIYLTKDATVIYDDFNIDEEVPLSQQESCLKEDMLQITFPSCITLDIGWYPEFNSKGAFRLMVIKDYNWEAPIFNVKTRNLKKLERAFIQAIEFIDHENKNG